MLEWDPAKRGQIHGAEEGGGGKQVIAFKLINEVLNKKVICVEYHMFHYVMSSLSLVNFFD